LNQQSTVNNLMGLAQACPAQRRLSPTGVTKFYADRPMIQPFPVVPAGSRPCAHLGSHDNLLDEDEQHETPSEEAFRATRCE
jgi:hypothetical protein